jgi:hypothetical protein
MQMKNTIEGLYDLREEEITVQIGIGKVYSQLQLERSRQLFNNLMEQHLISTSTM